MLLQSLLDASSDALSDLLDKQYGSEVTDNAIFYELPKFFEAEFTKDMDALNVSAIFQYNRVVTVLILAVSTEQYS